MTVAPPKCKTCGKAEWRHICGDWTPEKFTHAEVVNTMVKVIEKHDAAVTDLLLGKPTRKEYLKLKARERRARQKAAKCAK